MDNKLKKILITDDDEDIVMMIKDIIEGIDNTTYQFEIETALEGNSAIHFLENDFFDLAIIDLKMPNVNGDAIIKIIRSGGFVNKNIPFLVVSGALDNFQLDKNTRNLDNIYFIEKPFSFEKIERVVKLWIN